MGTSDVHVALARVTNKLQELGIPYAICGGMALNAHGYQRATTDVDLVLTAEGLAQFKAHALGLGWLERFPGSRGVKDTQNKVKIDILVTGGIPGDGTPRGVEFPDPAIAAVEIAGRRYVNLATLIEMKVACALSSPHRPRDYDDVIQLIRVNALGEHFAESMHPYVQAKYRELWGLAQHSDPLQE
ncbi:MAG: hypothetical protein WAT39_04185 [Planctomycetota bacterium]